MAIEIERKFLVQADWRNQVNTHSIGSIDIEQGYLNSDADRIVRIRTMRGCSGIHKDVHTGYITVKGRKEGISTKEFEYRIPYSDAKQMLYMCLPNSVIIKTRYYIPIPSTDGGVDPKLEIELDEFHERHTGLVMAEVELPSEDTKFLMPIWFGSEVTDDRRYSNMHIAMNPFMNGVPQ